MTAVTIESGAQSVNAAVNLPLKLTLLWTLYDSGHQPTPPEAARRASGPRGAASAALGRRLRRLPVRGAVAARQRRDARRAGVARCGRLPLEQELRADVHGAAAVPGMVVHRGKRQKTRLGSLRVLLTYTCSALLQPVRVYVGSTLRGLQIADNCPSGYMRF